MPSEFLCKNYLAKKKKNEYKIVNAHLLLYFFIVKTLFVFMNLPKKEIQFIKSFSELLQLQINQLFISYFDLWYINDESNKITPINKNSITCSVFEILIISNANIFKTVTKNKNKAIFRKP
jgi:hypothetical protein